MLSAVTNVAAPENAYSMNILLKVLIRQVVLLEGLKSIPINDSSELNPLI